MKLGLIEYFFRRTILSFKSSVLLNILTVVTITLTMLVLLTFTLIFKNMNSFLASQETAIGISVYLDDKITAGETEKLKKDLNSRKEFRSVRFVSKEDALKTFLGWNRNLGAVVGKMGENPFPASFEINLTSSQKSSEELASLAKELGKVKGVEDVRYSAEWIEKLSAFVKALRGIGIFILFFLLLATAFLVSNTIRLNIYSRRDEISIMRLVGATDFFIKLPFLLEGFVQGLAGTLLANGLLFVIYSITSPVFKKSLSYIVGGSGMVFLPMNYIVISLCLGALVGILGSDFAVRRFLRSER